MPFEAAAAATAAAAAICTLLMGLGANFPVALAPGMGLNAVVAFQIAGETGSWQRPWAWWCSNGLIVLVLVLAGVREAVMRAIPLDLRRAISVGIGLFIALIGVVNARLVVIPPQFVVNRQHEPTGHRPACHARLAAGAGAVARARRLADHRVAALEASARRDRHWHCVRQRSPRSCSASRHWPAGAWLRVPRFDTVFQADVRAALDIRLFAAAVLARDGRFLRHASAPSPRLLKTGNLHDRDGPDSEAALDSGHRLTQRADRRGVRRELRDLLHRVGRGGGRGRAHRPAHVIVAVALCGLHVRRAARRHRASAPPPRRR